jgi:hypothetical protein
VSDQLRLRQLLGLTSQREWLTMAQLAAHAPFPTAEAARKFVKRHADLPCGRKGRLLVVDKRVWDAYVTKDQKQTA